MKFNKKLAYTLLIASSAFLAYNTFAATSEPTLPAVPSSQQEVEPFNYEVNANDIEPAIIKDLKVLGNDIKTETQAGYQKTQNSIQKTTDNIKTTTSATSEEIKKTTQETYNQTIDAIKDASQSTAEGTQKVINNVSEGTNSAIKTTGDKLNDTKETIIKKLPALEEIQLPTVNKSSADNKPVKIEVSSQRIPAGTTIPLKLESQINTMTSSIGDQFNATLISDVIVGDNILLPAGSVVRGTVGKIQKANFLVREGKVMLIFDHIVTPAGKQIPVYAYMTGSQNVNYEGYITGGTSYSKEFKKDAAKGRDILVNSTTFGVDKGLAYLKGVPVVLTAPVCAIGGALGGGGYIVGKSVYNVFLKGSEVMLPQGTLLNITLSRSLDIPIN